MWRLTRINYTLIEKTGQNPQILFLARHRAVESKHKQRGYPVYPSRWRSNLHHFAFLPYDKDHHVQQNAELQDVQNIKREQKRIDNPGTVVYDWNEHGNIDKTSDGEQDARKVLAAKGNFRSSEQFHEAENQNRDA